MFSLSERPGRYKCLYQVYLYYLNLHVIEWSSRFIICFENEFEISYFCTYRLKKPTIICKKHLIGQVWKQRWHLKKIILPPSNPIPGIDWVEDHVDNYLSLLNHQFLGSIFISLILFKLRMNYIILLKYSSISSSSKLMNWEGEIRVGHCNRKIKKIGYFSNIEIFCLFDTYFVLWSTLEHLKTRSKLSA